jgi:hypothetical protein
MKNLQEATERICDLKGNVVALDALLSALIHVLPEDLRAALRAAFEVNAEIARTVLLHAPISEHTIAAFEHDISRNLALLRTTVHAR